VPTSAHALPAQVYLRRRRDLISHRIIDGGRWLLGTDVPASATRRMAFLPPLFSEPAQFI
jgi:hypothetical protein